MIAAHGPQAVAAAQLRGAARHARLRLDGPALLPQAGRLAARSLAALRRHPHPGVARHLRDRARASRPSRCGTRKLIIAWGNNVTWSNLHLTPLHQRGAAGRGQGGGRRPQAHQDRASRRICTSRSSPAPTWCWRGPSRRSSSGAARSTAPSSSATWRASRSSWPARARYSVADASRICGVPEADIRQLAEWYHTLSPAAISVGNGLERNQNGGSGIRAIFALPALAGKFGVPGGGLVNGAGFVFPKTPAELQRPDLLPPGTRTLNIVDMGQHLLDPTLSPPIKALFIYNHNPLVVHPDQNRMRRGLAREDLFTVGSDVVMTDSLAYADVVLPASQPLRVRRHLRGLRPALAAARRAGDPAAGRVAAQHRDLPAARRALRLHRPRLHRQRRRSSSTTRWTARTRAWAACAPSRLPTDRATAMTVERRARHPLQATSSRRRRPARSSWRPATSSRSTAARLPTFRAYETPFPLVLISPASDERITSTFGGLKPGDVTPPLEMHPDDAQGPRPARRHAWCGCGTSWARCTCRSRSPTRSGPAWCAA